MPVRLAGEYLRERPRRVRSGRVRAGRPLPRPGGRVLWKARRARDPFSVAWASAATFGWIMMAGRAAWVPIGVFERLMVGGPVVLVTGILAATAAHQDPEPEGAP